MGSCLLAYSYTRALRNLGPGAYAPFLSVSSAAARPRHNFLFIILTPEVHSHPRSIHTNGVCVVLVSVWQCVCVCYGSTGTADANRARVRGRADDATVPRAVMYFHSISCRRAQVRDFRPPRAHARPPRGARARAFCARACLALCGLCLRGFSGPRPRAVRHARWTRTAAWLLARHVAAATDARHARCSTAAWPSTSRAQQSWVFLSAIAARRASITTTFSPCSFAHQLHINCAGSGSGSAVCACYGSTGVCVLRADGTRHADGARVGDAQQTRRGHTRSSTHTNQCVCDAL